MAEREELTDIEENKDRGLFTLCFTDSKRKGYMATMKRFRIQSKLSPVISRGRGADQVLVAFHMNVTGLSTANKEKGNRQLVTKIPMIRSSIVSKI